MPRWIGLDIHRRVVEICVLDAAGQVLQRARCGTSRAELETLGRTVLRPNGRRMRVTRSWRIHYTRRQDVPIVEEFGPHDTGGAK